MDRGVVKVERAVNPIPDIEAFTIMGDPGCDGLGAEIMTTFAKGLSATRSDLAVILGDIVPIGKENVYQMMTQFMNIMAPFPVYMVCGNHDTVYYADYFGLRNYLLVNDRTLFVILDDSRRSFDDETLAFLRDSLANHHRPNVLLLFHIPPPNRVIKNSISQEAWDKLTPILAPYRSQIKYLLCGHVHTFFEDVVDGIPLIVSAGAGARLEVVSNTLDKSKTFHHVLRFTYDAGGSLVFEHITLDGKYFTRELADSHLKEVLREAFQAKCAAHVRYLLFAQDAQEKGFSGIAKLLRATAASEFYHARNHFNNLNWLGTLPDNLEIAAASETRSVREQQPASLAYAERKQHGLARYTFYEALEAEKVHEQLFAKALAAAREQRDLPEIGYFVCSSCGMTIQGEERPANCPICGAPMDKIRVVA